MADNIDSLQIEISADAQSASQSLDKLANTLLKLQKNMTGLSNINLSGFSGSLKQISKATSGLDVGKLVRYSQALSGLSKSVTMFASSGKRIDTAASALQKISGLDFSKLQVSGDFSGFAGLAQGMDSFADAATKLASVKPTEINRTVSALQKLQGIDLTKLGQGLNSISGADFTSLGNLGTAFQSFVSAMVGADKVSAATSKIFQSLAQLASSANNLSAIQTYLPMLSTEIRNFISAMALAPAASSSTVALVSSLSGIASAGGKIQKAASALPALTDGIRDFVTALSSMPQISESTLRAIEALAKLAPAGAKAGSAAKSLQKNISSLSGTMNGLRTGTTKAIGGLKSFAGQVLSMLGIAGGIYGIVNAIKSAINYSSDLAEAQNVVNQGFGSLSYMADEFADSALYAYGMSELQAKNTSGQFAAMARSLGVAQDQAAEMALTLTGLTGDLASFWNTSQDVASTALASVFTGETESLKKYGVVMTEANLQQFAYANGITKSISAMTQAEKTMLRYQYVLDATSVAQEDFVSTSGNWANQVRMLTGQLQTLAGIIGSGLVAAFLPVIRAANQALAAIIRFANGIASFLGGLFGIKDQTVSAGAGLTDVADSAGAVADNTEAAAGGISDVGSAAKKSQKELNGFMAGWHEVNNMTSSADSSGSGSASGLGTMGAGVSLPSEYELDITAEDEVSPVLEAIRNRFIGLKDLFIAGFKIGLGDTSVFDSIRLNMENIRQSLQEIFTDGAVVSGFNNLLDTLVFNAGQKTGAFISIGATIADNLTGGIAIYLSEATGRIQDYLVNMFNIAGRADTIATNFTVVLSDILTVFRGEDAKEISASITQIFIDGFMGVTELAAKFGTDVLGLILTPITENADGIKKALEETLGPISDILSTLADSWTMTWEQINLVYDEHISPLFESLTEGITEIVDTLLDGYNTYIAPVLDSLSEKFTEVWEGTIQPLLNNFIGLFGDVADFVKVVWENILQPLLNWVASKIMPVVAPVLEGLGSLVLTVFDGIGKTLDIFLTAARGVIQFVTDIFAGDWSAAWETVKDTFKSIWDKMPDFIKAPIRGIIGFINKMIGGVESGINSVIKALNKLSFDVPDWVPGIGGETFGFNFSTLSLPRIPQLAKGGIIKSATLAMIGEDGAEAVMPLERNTGWISTLANNIVDEMGNVRLDIMPDLSKYQFEPMDINMEKLTTKFQEEMGVQMEAVSIDLMRQNELLEDIVTAIDNKELQIGDDDIFKATQRGQRRSYRRTGKIGFAGI